MAVRRADYLTGVDLNLLRALQALLLERHVGKAARYVGTSQPAISRALAKLRVTFADEILVRVGQTMQPTPRALELKELYPEAVAESIWVVARAQRASPGAER